MVILETSIRSACKIRYRACLTPFFDKDFICYLDNNSSFCGLSLIVVIVITDDSFFDDCYSLLEPAQPGLDTG